MPREGPGQGLVASYPTAVAIPSELIGGVEHGNDVLGRHVRLDVVDLIEDVTAAGRENLDAFFNVLPDFVRRGVTEDALRVAPAAPEDQAVRRIPF